MKSKIYQQLTPQSEIDKVWDEYHKTKDRKLKSQLREEYRRLASEDEKQVGWNRYQKL